MRVTDSDVPLVTDRATVRRIPAEDIDFRLLVDGSISILWAVSDAAVGWVEEHLPEDATRWGDGYVVEHRYLGDIVYGIDADGLVIGQHR